MFDPKHTYWTNSGRYQDFLKTAYVKLVPSDGPTDISGKLLHAAAVLYDDHYETGGSNFERPNVALYETLRNHARLLAPLTAGEGTRPVDELFHQFDLLSFYIIPVGAGLDDEEYDSGDSLYPDSGDPDYLALSELLEEIMDLVLAYAKTTHPALIPSSSN